MLASGLAFFREAIMADQLISEQVMAIVGNTILVYQAIEHSMKDVAHHVDVSVPFTLNLDESKAKAAKIIGKRAKLIRTSTMGGVVKEYLKLFEPLTFSEAEESATEGSVRVKLELPTGAAERVAWAKEVEQLVAERNWVVHQSLLELCDATDAKRNGAVDRVKACNAHAHAVLIKVGRQAELTTKTRQLMAKDLAVCVEKVMLPSLCVTAAASDKEHMRPDKDGWVPLQRLLARCEVILGDALNDACGLTQTKKKLDFLKKQMGGFEFKEQKTKNGMRVMYRIPEAATPKKTASR
jgi:hypothetical protein